jgi:transcriptional regulator with XRE-family HTH domain
MSTFAERLKKLIDENNITQAELSRRTGISRALISAYLKGEYEAKQNNVFILAKHFNVNEAWLMGLIDNRNKNNAPDTSDHPLEHDIEKIFDGMLSYDGKEISDADKEVMRTFYRSYLTSRRETGGE